MAQSWLRRLLRFFFPPRFTGLTPLSPDIEAELKNTDWSRRDVLIGSFRNPSQFEICKARNFYYIPAERLGEYADSVRYVAMFQTPRIFGKDGGIWFFGAVRRTALLPRGAITEVPMRTNGNPNAPYYRFEIAQWVALEHPILPAEGAFVHEYTTLFLLHHAEKIQELLLQSEAEYRLYTEITNRCRQRRPKGLEAYGYRFLFSCSEIQVSKGGNTLCRFQKEAFLAKPMGTFRSILQAIQQPQE